MNDRSIGAARIEPNEKTTVRVYVERPNGESTVLFLEPGNGVTICEDGPVLVEAYAMEEDDG